MPLCAIMPNGYHVGLFGVLVALDVAQTSLLLFTPLRGHSVVKVSADLPVELVDVHGVDPALEPIIFGPKPSNRLLMRSLFVRMTSEQRLVHPSQYFVVEAQPAEQPSEPPLQFLLTYILAAARHRVAFAFVGITGAMVIDVALLLDLADHRAAAPRAGDQPGEGKIMPYPPMLLGEPAGHHTLHLLPQ